MRSRLLAFALLAACGDKDPVDTTPAEDTAEDSPAPVDADGDGSPAGEDCNDSEPLSFPGNPEVCDGVDNDCDRIVDETDAVDASRWYRDRDGDGYGDESSWVPSCNNPTNYIGEGGDCDDTDARIHPGAAPNDSTTDCMFDLDGDGWGDDTPPSNVIVPGTDCNDLDPASYPGAPTGCASADQDCDGVIDNDLDGDRHVSEECGGPDCEDDNPEVMVCDIGLEQSTAALSCEQINTENANPTDGVYWIDPDGDTDHSDAFQVYCDQTTDGGGWTLTYWVDANHFDGVFANNHTVTETAPTAMNGQSDIWNAERSLTFTEVMYWCTTQDNAATHFWSYSSVSPHTWFTDSAEDGYYNLTSVRSSTTAGTCFSTHSRASSYGFVVIEDGSCGSCNTMLYGMYHYPSSTGCNSTSTTYGTHASPWNGRSIQYPICNRSQTNNGQFRMAVR